MTTEHAYSTDNPETVAAYLKAVADYRGYADRMLADMDALGAGPGVRISRGMFGSRDQLFALDQKGDHIPDGWRIVRGHLVPRRGKPGGAARQWLADHQPVDIRAVMTGHGLPRSAWIPGSDSGYRVVSPTLFEHDGTLWACYEGEPGKGDSSFDSTPCTWTPRKLSEFYAAFEAVAAAQAAEAGEPR